MDRNGAQEKWTDMCDNKSGQTCRTVKGGQTCGTVKGRQTCGTVKVDRCVGGQ